MSRTSRHFRLESQRRQSIVVVAAVVLVCGAYLTTRTREHEHRWQVPGAALAGKVCTAYLLASLLFAFGVAFVIVIVFVAFAIVIVFVAHGTQFLDHRQGRFLPILVETHWHALQYCHAVLRR